MLTDRQRSNVGWSSLRLSIPGSTTRPNGSAIVVVEHGQIELECLDGSRHCFGRGSVLLRDSDTFCAVSPSQYVPIR